MADYIDRQAAIDVIQGYFDGMLETDTWSPCDVYGLIEILPSADAVEVVRCRDCKHNPNDTWFECPLSHLPYNEDRWCWKGEQKDD